MRSKLWLVVLPGLIVAGLYSQSAPPRTADAFRPNDPHAAAIIAAISPARIKQEDDKLVSFGSRLATAEAQSTATRGPVPARAWIVSQFQAVSDATGGRLQVKVDTFDVPGRNGAASTATESNVVATLPGTDPNDHRIFLVSGHYDSIPAQFDQDAPGANDDASGTIVSMECARALAAYSFPATIQFFTVEGEEQGLTGSTHAAKVAKDAGLDIAGVLNNDIVGGDQTPGQENRDEVRIFSQGLNPNATLEDLRTAISSQMENDSPNRELARYTAQVAAWFLPGFAAVLEYRPDRFQRGGDQTPWVNQGYPGVRITEMHENSNHQHVAVRIGPDGTEYGDTGKWISPDYIAQVARMNALTLASLASAPPPPAHVTFRSGQQVGNVITWTAVPGAAAYHLLLRPTAQPQWTERRNAPPLAAPTPGNAPAAAAPDAAAVPTYQMNIAESGDNYIIAVATVDAQGHESLPTIAGVPTRGGGRGRGATTGGGGGGGPRH